MRRLDMKRIAEEFVNRPIHDLVSVYGFPWEISESDKRSLYVWKSPPTTQLPTGSGLLIMAAEVNKEGLVEQIEWRDRMPSYT